MVCCASTSVASNSRSGGPISAAHCMPAACARSLRSAATTPAHSHISATQRATHRGNAAIAPSASSSAASSTDAATLSPPRPPASSANPGTATTGACGASAPVAIIGRPRRHQRSSADTCGGLAARAVGPKSVRPSDIGQLAIGHRNDGRLRCVGTSCHHRSVPTAPALIGRPPRRGSHSCRPPTRR